MSDTYIPGYLTVVTANSEDITANLEVVDFTQTRNIITKRVMGTKGTNKVSGKIDRSWSLRGNLTAEKAGLFEELFQQDQPFPFTLQIGEAGEATDAGLYTGEALVGSYNLTGNADGDYQINMDLQAHGDPEFTAGSSS